MTVCRDVIYALLQESSCKKDLAGGRHVQALMVAHGFDTVAVLGDHLIRLFASCETLLEANLIFCNIAKPSVFTWHSIISAHVAMGETHRSILLYHKMQSEGSKPDKFIYTSILKACADTGNDELGSLIHDLIVRSSLESDVVVGSSLIDMYAKCGSWNEAFKIFSKLFSRNAVSWNTLIAQCDQYGLSAFEFFGKMQEQGVQPERSTFSSILKACAMIGDANQGKLVHEKVIESGLEVDVIVGSTLIDMYCKCGNLKVAREVFDKMQDRDVVSWGSIISGYVEHGEYYSALQLFVKLLDEDIRPNKVVLSCVLKACASTQEIGKAREIHHYIIKNGFETDKVVGSSLIDIYTKCGSLHEARKTFDLVIIKDVVSWNAIITGHVLHEDGNTALLFFMKMLKGGVRPDRITYLGTLKACVVIGALSRGKVIHDYIIRDNLDLDISIGSALVDMYAKCGRLHEAHVIFDGLPEQNIVSWGAIISGYAESGCYGLVDQCLQEMSEKGLKTNSTIFVNILSACSQEGKVEESRKYFHMMINTHGITPKPEHFNCMIDILGRAGCLKEAKGILESMPNEADITCWVSLLAACRTYGSVQLAKECFDQLVNMDPEYASSYVLLSKLYADMNMWDDFRKIQDLRKKSRAWKKAGMAWIDVKNRAQQFTVEGSQGTGKVHNKMKTLRKAMLEFGYMPQIDTVDKGKGEGN